LRHTRQKILKTQVENTANVLNHTNLHEGPRGRMSPTVSGIIAIPILRVKPACGSEGLMRTAEYSENGRRSAGVPPALRTSGRDGRATAFPVHSNIQSLVFRARIAARGYLAVLARARASSASFLSRSGEVAQEG